MSETVNLAKALIKQLHRTCCNQDIDARSWLEICDILPKLVAEVERLQEYMESVADSLEIVKAPGFDRSQSIIQSIRDLWDAYHSNLRYSIQTEERAKKADASRALPEWRPLSVLTREVATKWHTWAVTYPGSHCAVLCNLTVVALIKADSWPTLLAWHIRHDNLGCDGWTCRPVDREGIPVPWSEVGL